MERQMTAIPETLSSHERVSIIMQRLIAQRERAALDAVIDAIRRGQRSGQVGGIDYYNIKSKEEVLAQLNDLKQRSTEPLYIGPPVAFIDEMLAKLQS